MWFVKWQHSYWVSDNHQGISFFCSWPKWWNVCEYEKSTMWRGYDWDATENDINTKLKTHTLVHLQAIVFKYVFLPCVICHLHYRKIARTSCVNIFVLQTHWHKTEIDDCNAVRENNLSETKNYLNSNFTETPLFIRSALISPIGTVEFCILLHHFNNTFCDTSTLNNTFFHYPY